MKNKNINDVNLTLLYDTFFTEAMIFSKNYEQAVKEGKLDSLIKERYLYNLNTIIEENAQDNIYPTSYNSSLLEFVVLLKERVKKLELESEYASYFDSMEHGIVSVLNDDCYEIYNLEYCCRYSKIDRQVAMVPKERLEDDIRRDYIYLDIIMDGKLDELDKIGGDFLFFLNKLFVECLDIKLYPKMISVILKILEQKDLPGKEDYIHLLKDKRFYHNEAGFNLESLKSLYTSVSLHTILNAENQKEMFRKEKKYLSSFRELYTLKEIVSKYQKAEEINPKEKKNLLGLISCFRNNLDMYPEDKKSEVNDMLNAFILTINGLEKETERPDGYPILEKLYDVIYQAREKLKVKTLAYPCLILLKYFYGDVSIEEVKKLKDKDAAIKQLFTDYPKMFFDKTIYSKTMEVLEDRKVKQKINHIRKG